MLRGKPAHIPTLRAAYTTFWDQDWPHNDKYLRELTREATSVAEVLMLMREADNTIK